MYQAAGETGKKVQTCLLRLTLFKTKPKFPLVSSQQGKTNTADGPRLSFHLQQLNFTAEFKILKIFF